MNNTEIEWQKNFTDVLTRIDNFDAMSLFLKDVMTDKEIKEMASRLQAATLLRKKESYVSVCRQTGLSSRTVARISDWLKRNNGGYATAISIIEKHHPHR